MSQQKKILRLTLASMSWWLAYAILCSSHPLIYYIMSVKFKDTVSDKVLFEQCLSGFFIVSTISGFVTCCVFSLIIDKYIDETRS